MRRTHFVDASLYECYSFYWMKQERRLNLNKMHTEEEAMSKEQLLQEMADAYEKVIQTATEVAQRGVTHIRDEWRPLQIVAHLAGWEVMATVRVPAIVAGIPPKGKRSRSHPL